MCPPGGAPASPPAAWCRRLIFPVLRAVGPASSLSSTCGHASSRPPSCPFTSGRRHSRMVSLMDMRPKPLPGRRCSFSTCSHGVASLRRTCPAADQGQVFRIAIERPVWFLRAVSLSRTCFVVIQFGFKSASCVCWIYLHIILQVYSVCVSTFSTSQFALDSLFCSVVHDHVQSPNYYILDTTTIGLSYGTLSRCLQCLLNLFLVCVRLHTAIQQKLQFVNLHLHRTLFYVTF